MNDPVLPQRRHITSRKISIPAVLRSVEDDGAGAVVLFLGTVRNTSEAGSVEEINYESYSAMAEKRLAEIEANARRVWPIRAIRILHRIGRLRVGEVSLAVAISAPHRAEAYDASRHIIERIKHEVPIWKKEKLTGGSEVWVEGRRME